MKKAISLSLILCVLITAVFFTSCGNEADEPSSAVTEASKAEEQSTPSDVSEETSAAYVPDIYSGTDYFGKTFTVWSTTWNTSAYTSEIIFNEGNYDEMISDGVNNAIQARNDRVYDTLGVKIDEIYYGSPTRYGSDTLTYIRNFIDAADPDISAFCICLYDCGTLSLEGVLYDLYSLDNINPENPWWEQYFNESVTIDNKLYFTIGDIGFTSMGQTPCVFYNADLIEDLGLEDPVKVAIAGNWTLDKALEYSKSLCIDSAEPIGRMDYHDQYGWSGQYDDIYAMIYGAGVRILSTGSDGYPVLTLNNETTIGTVDKLIALMNDDSYMSGNDYFNESNTPMELLVDAFEAGRCIFYSSGVYMAARFEMPDVFGILPVPKFSAEQERYYSLLNTWTTNAYCIGANLDKEGAEFAAAVLDVMGYYSWKEYPDSIATNYYGVMLKNQKLALEDSEAMLDLIFEARGCEVGSIYQIGKLNGGTKAVNDVFVDIITNNTSGGFASKYESYADIFENDVSTLIDTFKNAE